MTTTMETLMESELNKNTEEVLNPFPDYMTTAQVAGIVNVTSQTVRDWVKRGALEAVRVGPGRHYRIPKQALRDLIVTMHGEVQPGMEP